MVKGGTLLNCDVAVDDVRRAVHIQVKLLAAI